MEYSLNFPKETDTIIDFAAIINSKLTYFSLFGMADINKIILKIFNKNFYFDLSKIIDDLIKKTILGDADVVKSDYYTSTKNWLLYESIPLHKKYQKSIQKYIYEPIGYSKNIKYYSTYITLCIHSKYFISALERPNLHYLKENRLEYPDNKILAAELQLSCEGKYSINYKHKFMIYRDEDTRFADVTASPGDIRRAPLDDFTPKVGDTSVKEQINNYIEKIKDVLERLTHG
jgi:hypothetical protein